MMSIITTNDVSVALHKKGWMQGSLRVGARRGRFVMVVAETPLNITHRFVNDLTEGMRELDGKKYNVRVDQIQWDKEKQRSTVAFDVRLDGDKVMLGDVVLSASGYTGQVEELEDLGAAGGNPNLARVFWYKFKVMEDNFYSWETADNLTVLNYPIPGQWWPGLNPDMPGNPIPKDRPWNRNPVGTPIHELVAGSQRQDFQAVLDAEAEMNYCACGCGKPCKKSFAPGHDAKAHRLLREFIEGRADGWKPTPKLLRYVTTHEAWKGEFQAALSEIQPGGAH